MNPEVAVWPKCETCGHHKGEHHAQQSWETAIVSGSRPCYHSDGLVVADCRCRDFAAVEGCVRHRWQPTLYDGRWVEYCLRGCGASRPLPKGRPIVDHRPKDRSR